MRYTLGSLFDGSGGFPLAGSLCGVTPVWASEVEPYPIAVTRNRFPGMKHLGDISKVNGGEIEPVDIVTFGSPCQDLSVAGKRAGLKHEANGDEETTRSGLFMEAVRIIKEMREATNGEYPRFALWENVPGAFSSNKGEDFRVVLEELIKIVEPEAVMPAVPAKGWAYADTYIGDGWSLAYRVFDAQHWGVPQRRRRIHLVLDLRNECAGKVLFEREGVRRYFTEGRTPWKSVTGNAENCAGTDDREGECLAYSFDSLASNSMKSKNPNSGCRQVEVSKTLDCFDPSPAKNQGGIAVLQPVPYTPKIRSGCEGGGKGALIQEDKSATLATNNDQYLFQPVAFASVAATLRAGAGAPKHAVICKCYDARGNGDGKTVNTITGDHENRITDYTEHGQANAEICENKSPCLNCNHDQPIAYGVDCRDMNEYPDLYYTMQAKPNGGQSLNFSGAVRIRYIVRRMTPTECARLQGFPYIVRRMTPTECARLQGFPDTWGHPDIKEDFTDEEYSFWVEVRNTHAAINGKKVKEYTKKQMLTWYNKLHTDSAEYKMWGNGIALPPALYCMQGMVDALGKEEQ